MAAAAAGGGGGEPGAADEIMWFVSTRKQRRYFSPFLMIRDPGASRRLPCVPVSPAPRALQINLLMDDRSHALPVAEAAECR